MIKETPFSNCYLILTEDCNLHCKYCFENENRCNNNYMSFDIAKESADFLFDNALKHGMKDLSWTFIGGEPLLNLDVMIKFFHYTIDKAKQHNIKLRFSIITNGTIYNKQLEEFLIEWNKATRNIVIQISIDGIPEVHDKNRITANGKPTSQIVYENILKFKKFFNENKIKPELFNTNSVFDKDNISKIFLNYKYLSPLDIDSISFGPSRYENWDEMDISIYLEQLSLIADYVYDECIKSGSLAPFKKTDRIFWYRPPDEFYKTSCAARLSECAIVPNGDIYPRPSLYFSDRRFKLGNIFDGIIENNTRYFFDICEGNIPADNIFCDNCEATECNIYKISNYIKLDEAKKPLLIEIEKRFNKLYDKLNYNKCTESAFVKAINQGNN